MKLCMKTFHLREQLPGPFCVFEPDRVAVWTGNRKNNNDELKNGSNPFFEKKKNKKTKPF